MTVCSYIYWLLMLAYCRVSKNCGHFPVPVGYPKFISRVLFLASERNVHGTKTYWSFVVSIGKHSVMNTLMFVWFVILIVCDAFIQKPSPGNIICLAIISTHTFSGKLWTHTFSAKISTHTFLPKFQLMFSAKLAILLWKTIYCIWPTAQALILCFIITIWITDVSFD